MLIAQGFTFLLKNIMVIIQGAHIFEETTASFSLSFKWLSYKRKAPRDDISLFTSSETKNDSEISAI